VEITIWKRARDPSMQVMKFDVFFIIFVVLPEIGFFIWGNTFIYSKEIYNCRIIDKDLQGHEHVE